MAGLFDGLRTSVSGLNVHRLLQEVVGNNIANAANKDFSRQEATVVSNNPINDGDHFMGQGARIDQVRRVRDSLIDEQLRVAQTGAAKLEIEEAWLTRIQATLNEPSDTGIRQGVSDFWESWSELSVDPDSVAAKANTLNATENIVSMIHNLNDKFDNIRTQIDQDLISKVDQVNNLTVEISKLNKEIFEAEVGQRSEANTLRDRRDAALDELSRLVDIAYHPSKNGQINIFIAGQPAVIEERVEKLLVVGNPSDASEKILEWEFGDRADSSEFGGTVQGLFNVRDNLLGDYQKQLDGFANAIITEVNKIYSNGIGENYYTIVESSLGFEALGTAQSTDPLGLVTAGENGEIHVSFYDSTGEVIRTGTVVVESTDSLDDIAVKFNNIAGITGALISHPINDGRLQVEFDTASGDNQMGEVGFTISNNTGAYDTSGFLSLLGFDETSKSTTPPTVSSRDLSELQTILGEANITDVRAKALGLSGSFTINAYETLTETAGETDGIHMQQLRIDIASTDSIDSVMNKINALTASQGVSISYNVGSQALELTHSGVTDASNNFSPSGVGAPVRLAFFNGYRYPTVSNDSPPKNYNGLGDNTNLLATLQMNTLFQGSDAETIDIDINILREEMLHTGFKLKDGANGMTLALNELQHIRLTDGFTIGEDFENMISDIGNDVKQTSILKTNEEILVGGFVQEKERVSGVNLDEELANMMIYQRAYEANARMVSTFNQLMEEVLNIVR